MKNIDITKLEQTELYEYLKSLDEETQMKIVEEVNSKLNSYSEKDLIFLKNFSIALEKINEDSMYREKFYFELYNLIDKNGNLTKLGQYYEYIFTHHYIKAIKEYMKFPESLKKKNEIFRTNDKALEYLEYFRNQIKYKRTKTLKKDR